MINGTQFTGTLGPGQTQRWFTWGWPAEWHVIWQVVPTSPQPGGPQVRWDIQVERASSTHATYWIDVTNLTGATVQFEGRYTILN